MAVYLFSLSAHVHDVSIALLDVASLWSLLVALEVMFGLFFTIFVLSINKKYIATFFSTMTAKEFSIQSFRSDASSDQTKIQILDLHPSYYASIRGEVKAWVEENYNGWVEENPDWFTERVRASIPRDMIPKDEKEEW